MEKIIEFRKYPLDLVLDKLLMDKTTGKPIIWATNSYSKFGNTYCDRFSITLGALQGINSVLIQPRAFKALETQQQRTKSKAEVFTPSWIVNKMINHLDEEWFGRSEVFNIEDEQSWKINNQKIDFEDKKWEEYVDQTVLEITCGEVPFIVSRYNASTGEIIPIEERIGILDRKLRVVTENTDNEKDWLKWTKRAFESVYGYEYQGDNLLIGRINLLMTYLDYYQSVWKKEADKSLLTSITNIITWNFWQMDGLNGTVPLGVPQPLVEQMTLFDDGEEQKEQAPLCKVKKWRAKKTILYKKIETIEGVDMGKKKWDIVLGNPPYQIEAPGTSTSEKPIYHLFWEAAKQIGQKVELITPGRFLFNAGATPKNWNEKMLNDPHLKVEMFEQKSSIIFPGTDIKGGVAIAYWDSNTLTEPIVTFTPYPELNSLIKKIKAKHEATLDKIVSGRGVYKLSNKALKEKPEIINLQSKGHKKDVGSGAFKVLSDVVFYKEKPNEDADFVQFLGLLHNKREYYWTRLDYQDTPESFYNYKVFIPKANGSGAIGEVLSTPLVGAPLVGATESFLSIGNFKTLSESENCMRYIKTKFARAALGVLKITQDNTRDKWKYVPLQDFTSNSDIDWSKSISEIDQQLYKKYDLSLEEIEFIESHVKEME